MKIKFTFWSKTLRSILAENTDDLHRKYYDL